MRYVRCIVLVLVVACASLATAAFAIHREPPPAPVGSAAIHPHVHEQWRVPIASDLIGMPATDQAGVVLTAGNSQVIAVSRDGKIDWTAAVEGALVHPPRIDDDLVFVAGARAVAALQRDTGNVIWSVPTTAKAEDNRANRPVVAGDVVVITAADGLMVGVDRASGAERWRKSLPTAVTSEPAVGSTADDRPVVVIVGLAEWWGIDPATGATLWSGDLGLFGTSSPIVYPDGLDLVAAVASDEHMLAVDAHSGAPLWDAHAEQSELYQVPVLGPGSSNELLVPDHWGRLTAYDRYNGKRLWSTHGADGVAEFGAPVWLADKFVALALDIHGPRLASPAGSVRLSIDHADGFAVAELPAAFDYPKGGLVVTTGREHTNYVLLYSVR